MLDGGGGERGGGLRGREPCWMEGRREGWGIEGKGCGHEEGGERKNHAGWRGGGRGGGSRGRGAVKRRKGWVP